MTEIINMTRGARIGRTIAVSAAVLLAGALGSAGTLAGDLSLAWTANHDDVTAGYEVEVLDASGSALQTVDTGSETRARITGLSDGETYRFRVRPYDRWGRRADDPSTEIVTMPAPRVDQLSRWDVEAGTGMAELQGVNFAPGARVLSRNASIVVLGVDVAGPGRLTVQVKAAPGASPLAADFIVVNPARRSEAYLAAHPELLDIDQSGTIDEDDANAVARAFGAEAQERTMVRAAHAQKAQAELDVNGDGVVDGEDVAAIRARITTTARRVNRASRP